ncbi:serine protease inhibitor 88Ea-like [Neodiprion fabricii]|uniref:serine protease inhibitor 88Ea-like n=1 Tax=Neodiprion fabricii TaxID=2872261 RepID=UPI001ED92AA3|nr:serine protease inhibitor 88Ea-like [Neodiprion fabricii]
MYNIAFVCLALCAAFLGMTSGQCLTGNDNPTMIERDFNQKLSQARLDFALDTLRKTSEFEGVDNIFYSPHSLHEALTLAYFSARGTTEAALGRALHIPEIYSKTHVQRFYVLENALRRFMTEQGNVSTNYEFRTANKLWVTKERRIRECMLDLFNSELEHVDFRSNPEAIRQRVNQWASNETKGHIQNLIPDGGITEDSDLVLANAVYFKGLWKSKFDAANSKKDNFYSNGSRTHLVTFMKQKGTFSHVVSEEIGAHILQLPYKGDDVSMYILLPPFAGARIVEGNDTRDAVQQLIERITGTERAGAELRDILEEGMAPREVEIFIPRFSFDKELAVNQLLNAIGAGEVLTSAADFTGLLADGEPGLHLGDAVHRAVIEVTEEGTKATAATAIFSFRSSRPAEPAVFNANHPFLYFIYDRLSRSILFAGVYRTPPLTTSASYV